MSVCTPRLGRGWGRRHATRRLTGGKGVLSADCERRERQRQMKNDGRCAYGQTARPAFFRGVEPEAAQNALAGREANGALKRV